MKELIVLLGQKEVSKQLKDPIMGVDTIITKGNRFPYLKMMD